MTTIDDAAADGPVSADARDGLTAAAAGRLRWWERFETLLERAGEHLNPILVKEARQALKSRQFTITFSLVLMAAWGWSFLGIAWIGPQAYYAAHGPGLLYGYTLILMFALLIIVPYSAFRSLAAELEDRTYELLSITTLKARQIVGGKLSSALLQILVYLSALSPCIAFTYLLRGVDILTILMVVAYASLASLGLSLIGILVATCAMERVRQVVMSVVLALALGGLFLSGCELAEEIVQGLPAVDLTRFFIGNAALLTAYASTFVLLYLAAAAQLSFASSNRSTAMRIAMVAQQACYCGWMTYAWLEANRRPEPLIALMLLSGVYWYVMGAFLNGEPKELSPRVRRDLPQSFLGRALFTWFNPGPGSGWLFAVSNYLAIVLLAQVAAHYAQELSLGARTINSSQLMFDTGLLSWCYVTIYLGLGKLILDAARRIGPVSVLLRVMVNLLLVAIGSVGPLVIQLSFHDTRNQGYSLLQITNPFWTVVEVCNPWKGPVNDIEVLRIALPTAAVGVLLMNLRGVAAEVRQTRIAKPQRVADEDVELALENAPTEPVRTSPWG